MLMVSREIILRGTGLTVSVTIFEVVILSAMKLTLNRRHLGIAVADVASEVMGRERRITARDRDRFFVSILVVGHTRDLWDPKPPSQSRRPVGFIHIARHPLHLP